jgi:hypothetical protein
MEWAIRWVVQCITASSNRRRRNSRRTAHEHANESWSKRWDGRTWNGYSSAHGNGYSTLCSVFKVSGMNPVGVGRGGPIPGAMGGMQTPAPMGKKLI